MTILSRDGYSIPLDDLSEEKIAKVKKDLTIKPKIFDDFGQEIKTYKIYQEDDQYLHVPKFYGINHFGLPKVDNLDKGKKINIKFTKELRDYQEPIVDKLHQHLKTKFGGVLTLPCGRGKTAMAINL